MTFTSRSARSVWSQSSRKFTKQDYQLSSWSRDVQLWRSAEASLLQPDPRQTSATAISERPRTPENLLSQARGPGACTALDRANVRLEYPILKRWSRNKILTKWLELVINWTQTKGIKRAFSSLLIIRKYSVLIVQEKTKTLINNTNAQSRWEETYFQRNWTYQSTFLNSFAILNIWTHTRHFWQ